MLMFANETQIFIAWTESISQFFSSISVFVQTEQHMLAEITKMTAQLFISELGFVSLYLRNIKGLIDSVKTWWLQSERALSDVRSSIRSRGFCEEDEKKLRCVWGESRQQLSSALCYKDPLHCTEHLSCSVNGHICATRKCVHVCVDGRTGFVYGYMQKHVFERKSYLDDFHLLA